MRKTFKFSRPIKDLTADVLFKELEDALKFAVSGQLGWLDKYDDPQPYEKPPSHTELMYYGYLWNISYTALEILRQMLQEHDVETATKLASKHTKLQMVLSLAQ